MRSQLRYRQHYRPVYRYDSLRECSEKCPGIHGAPDRTTLWLPATVTVTITATIIGPRRGLPTAAGPAVVTAVLPAVSVARLSRNRYRRMCRPPAGREWECVRPGGRRRVDHGAWAAVGEGVPEVGLSGAPVTATPKRRRRTHPCSWRGQLLVVLLGCSPYCRALVRALAHVTGALTAVIRCPDGSRHGQTGGVAWRRGGGLRLPSTASAGRSHVVLTASGARCGVADLRAGRHDS